MAEPVKKISENTLVPLSLVIALVGGMAWLTSIKSDAKSLRDDLNSLRDQQTEYMRTLQKIDERLSRIEGKLGIHGSLLSE